MQVVMNVNPWGLTLMIASLAVMACGAQAEDDSRPASSNVRGAEYPRVHRDLRVTFRLKAPEARKVQVQPGGGDNGLGRGPIDMERGADGVWSVTTAPAVPGFHYYWFLVDGVAMNDPSSEAYFGWGKPTSGVEVPEPGVSFYDAKEVPHGEVRILWYHSRVTSTPRRAYVYTPPGYDASPTSRYPVLYLQHGAGEDERGWVNQGRMNFIMDNLLGEGKVRPMIVVMENGYATIAGPPPPAPPPGSPAPPRFDFRGFEKLVLEDLIPKIDATYRTLPDREHRAMAGLSMGGMQTLQIGLNHLDRFAYIGSFSGPPLGGFDVQTSYGGVFTDPAAFHRKVRLLWLGAGTAEERFITSMRAMHAALEKAGIRHVVFESAGTAHEWQTWRKSLYDFAPRLFRE